MGFWKDRVRITGGIRLQEFGSKSYAANATGAIPAGGLTGQYSKDAVTPVFGLVVKPAEGVSLYANRVEGLVPGATAAARPGERRVGKECVSKGQSRWSPAP